MRTWEKYEADAENQQKSGNGTQNKNEAVQYEKRRIIPQLFHIITP